LQVYAADDDNDDNFIEAAIACGGAASGASAAMDHDILQSIRDKDAASAYQYARKMPPPPLPPVVTAEQPVAVAAPHATGAEPAPQRTPAPPPVPEILETLRGKGKCVVHYTRDMMSGVFVGAEVVIKYGDTWQESVVDQVPPRRRNACSEPREFRVLMINLPSPNNLILTELNEDNYATGCIAPRSIGDRLAWARVGKYSACAYVDSGKCDYPYLSADGHHCVLCKHKLHLLCSHKHAGQRPLGSELCDLCRPVAPGELF
jgi:hypothetical protein